VLAVFADRVIITRKNKSSNEQNPIVSLGKPHTTFSDGGKSRPSVL